MTELEKQVEATQNQLKEREKQDKQLRDQLKRLQEELERQKAGKWRPKKGEWYQCVSSFGCCPAATIRSRNDEDPYDRHRFSIGNCFPDTEEGRKQAQEFADIINDMTFEMPKIVDELELLNSDGRWFEWHRYDGSDYYKRHLMMKLMRAKK